MKKDSHIETSRNEPTRAEDNRESEKCPSAADSQFDGPAHPDEWECA